jgi:hypothetical protein
MPLAFSPSNRSIYLSANPYASKKGLSYCLSHEADFILRLRFGAFSMFLNDGERMDLPKRLPESGHSLFPQDERTVLDRKTS